MKHSISKDLFQPILRSGKKLDSFNSNACNVTPKKSMKILCQRKQTENSPDAAPTTSRITMSGVKDEVHQNDVQQTAIKLKFESKISHSRIISEETFNMSSSPKKQEPFKNCNLIINETYDSRNKAHDKENSISKMSPSKVIQQYGFNLQIKEVSNPFIDQQAEKRKQSAERFKQSKIYSKKTSEMQKKSAKNKNKEISNPEIISNLSNQNILKVKICPKNEQEQEKLGEQDQHMISFTFGDEDQKCHSPDNALKVLMRSTQQQKLKQQARVQDMIAFHIQYQNQIEQLEPSPIKSPLKEEINVESKFEKEESNIQQEQEIDLNSYIKNENTSYFNDENSAHVESITYSEIHRQAENLQRQNLQIEKRLSFLQLPRVPSFDSFEIDSALYGKVQQLNSSLLQQKKSLEVDEDSLCENQENIDILQQSESNSVDQTENYNRVVATEQINNQEDNTQKSRRKSRKQRDQSRPKTQAHFLKICDEEQKEKIIEEVITPLTNPSKKNQVQSCTFEEQLFYEQQIQQMQAELSLLGRQENELFIEVKEEIYNVQDQEELVEDSEQEKVDQVNPEILQQISITTADQPKVEMPIPTQQTQFLFSIGQGLFECQKDFERERESQNNSVVESSPCQSQNDQIDQVEVEIEEKEVEVDAVSPTHSDQKHNSLEEEKKRFLMIKENFGSELALNKNYIQQVQQLQVDFNDINSSTSIMSNLAASQKNSPPTKKGSFIINKFSIKNLINRVEEHQEFEENNFSQTNIEKQQIYNASPLIQLSKIPSSEQPQQFQIEFFDQIQDNCGYRFQINPIVSGRGDNDVSSLDNQNFDLQQNLCQTYNDNFTETQTFVPLIQLSQVTHQPIQTLEPQNDDGSQIDLNITSRLSNQSFTGKERRSRKNRSQSGGKTKINVNIKQMKAEMNGKNEQIKLTETTIFQPGFIQQRNIKTDEPQNTECEAIGIQFLGEQQINENPTEVLVTEPNILEISPQTSKSTEGKNRLSLFKKSQQLTLPEQSIQEIRTPVMINSSQAQSPLIVLQQMMQMQKKNGQQNYSEVSFQERAILKQEQDEQQYEPVETVQCQQDQILILARQESPQKITAKSVKKDEKGREYFSVLSDPGSSMLSTQMLKQQEEPPVSPSLIQNFAYPGPSPFLLTAQRRKSPQETSNIKSKSTKKQSTVKKTTFNKTQQVSNATGVKIQDSWVKQISEFLSVPHHFGLDLTKSEQNITDDKSENSCLNNLIITTTDRRKHTIAQAEAVLAKTTIVEKYDINKSIASISQDFSMVDFKMFDTQNKSIESHENPHHFSKQSVGQSKSQNYKNDYFDCVDDSSDQLLCSSSYLARHGKNEARIRLHEQSNKHDQSTEKNQLDTMYQECVQQPRAEVQRLGDDGQVRLRLQPSINVINNIQQMNRVTQQVKDKIKSKYSVPNIKNSTITSARTSGVKSAQKLRNQKVIPTYLPENLQNNPALRFKTKTDNQGKVNDSRFSFGDQSALYQITNRSDIPQLQLQQPIKTEKVFCQNSKRSTNSKESKFSDYAKSTDMPYAFNTIDQTYIYKTKISQAVATLKSSYTVLKKPAIKPKAKLDQSIEMLKSRMSETSHVSSAVQCQKKQGKLGDWK